MASCSLSATVRARNEMVYREIMNRARILVDENLPASDQVDIANTELHSFLGYAKGLTDATFWNEADISLAMAMAAAFFSPNVRWFYSLSTVPSLDDQCLRLMSAVIDPSNVAAKITAAKTIYADPGRHPTNSVADHIKSQIARCFWTGLPIDDRAWQTEFTIGKIFPIEGLDDIQNLVVTTCATNALLGTKHRVYIAAKQAIEIGTSENEEVTYPDYLEHGINGIGKWIGSHGTPSNRTFRSRDTSRLTVNLNGSRVCPRVSSRTRIAFAYLFLRDKYPSLAHELDQFLPFNVANKWVTGSETGADVCWQAVTFYLQGDIVPWFQLDPEKRQKVITAGWNVYDLYTADESKTPFAPKPDQTAALKTTTVISSSDVKMYCIQLVNPARTVFVTSTTPMSEDCAAAITRYKTDKVTSKQQTTI